VFGQVRKDGTAIQTDIWHQDLPLPGHAARLVSAHDVTEHARAAAAEAEQRVLAEALRDSAAALNSTLDFDEVLTRILENTARVMPHDTVDIMRVDRGVARIVRGRGFERFGLEEARVLDLEFPLDRFPNLRLLAETRQPRVTTDTRTDPLWVEVAGLEWVRSHVGSPIVARPVDRVLNPARRPKRSTPRRALRCGRSPISRRSRRELPPAAARSGRAGNACRRSRSGCSMCRRPNDASSPVNCTTKSARA
jgi:hypothetical protein